MSNLVFFNGSYTLSIVCSLLLPGNNVFIAYIRNNNGDKGGEKKILPDNPIYTNIIGNKQILNWFYFKQATFKKQLFLQHIPDIQNIYLPINSSTIKLHKTLSVLYKNAVFIFYEEGLLSYLKPLFNKKLNLLLKKYASYYVGYGILNNYLKHFFSKHNVNIINKARLQAVFLKQQNILDCNLDLNKKYCLVLPQYYYQNNKKKFMQLALAYSEELKQLSLLGYSFIVKEHPKASKSILDYINIYYNTDNITVIKSTLPVEAIKFPAHISLVFSVYSTALLSMSYLYNTPVKTSNKLLQLRMNWFSFYPTLSALLIKYAFRELNYGIIANETDENRKDINEANINKTDTKAIFFTRNIIFNYLVKFLLIR